MSRRYRWLLLGLMVLAGCQQMPPREEMLNRVCAQHPCRSAEVLYLQDKHGERHPVAIPAGPIFVAGWLSVVTGEQHALALSEGPEGQVHASWLAGVVPGGQRFRIELSQGNDNGRTFSELRLHNPLDRPLFLQMEQLVVGEDRFHPLPLPPIPPGDSVRKRWDHTILEIQVLGFQALGERLQ